MSDHNQLKTNMTKNKIYVLFASLNNFENPTALIVDCIGTVAPLGICYR